MANGQCIETFPKARLTNLFRRRGPFSDRLSRFTSLHPLARTALYWAFMGIRTGHQPIAWLPSYHCGVEVQAAVEAGFEVGFYRLHADLSVDEADLLRKVADRPGPILLIHYFGFPQPAVARLAALCQERRWILIEDCAHALFSSNGHRMLGDYAPIAVYSLYKALPTFEGGALRVDRDFARNDGVFPPSLRPRSPSLYVGSLRNEAAHLVGTARVARLREAFGFAPENPDEPETFELGPRREEGVFSFSRHLAAQADPERVVRLRRQNYKRLDQYLAQHPGYCRVFGELPDHVSPLCLPIVVSRRSEFSKELYRRNIRAYVFGAFPHPSTSAEAVQNSKCMRDNIIGLPVHQELEPAEIERMAEVLDFLLQRHGPELSNNVPAVCKDTSRM